MSIVVLGAKAYELDTGAGGVLRGPLPHIPVTAGGFVGASVEVLGRVVPLMPNMHNRERRDLIAISGDRVFLVQGTPGRNPELPRIHGSRTLAEIHWPPHTYLVTSAMITYTDQNQPEVVPTPLSYISVEASSESCVTLRSSSGGPWPLIIHVTPNCGSPPRHDMVVERSGSYFIREGAPAASPIAPATPADARIVAEIRWPGYGAGILRQTMITNRTEPRTMSKQYRIQKQIDVTLTPDADGDFRVREIMGTSVGTASGFVAPGPLCAAGWTLTPVSNPASDPVGTIRHDLAGEYVKVGPDQWRRIYTASITRDHAMDGTYIRSTP